MSQGRDTRSKDRAWPKETTVGTEQQREGLQSSDSAGIQQTAVASETSMLLNFLQEIQVDRCRNEEYRKQEERRREEENRKNRNGDWKRSVEEMRRDDRRKPGERSSGRL